VAEAYPKLLRFAEYLVSIRGKDGLFPVENLGIPAVWIDHCAYKKQAHKQCAFNLYAAAMFQHALAPLARAFGQEDRAAAFEALGASVLEATQKRYWDADKGVFVANLPWAAEEKETRLCDRSLATSILFNQCPGGNTAAALDALVKCPPEMGVSYPANAYWRYWALARLGRVDVVLDDFRKRWATMDSVRLNNSLQEMWTAPSDSTDEWSHCPVCPLYFLYMDIAGIRATSPGFKTCDIRPQLANIGDLDVTARTVRGPFTFKAVHKDKGYDISLTVPQGVEATLVLPKTRRVRCRRQTTAKTQALPGTASPPARRIISPCRNDPIGRVG
jgi:alpha-L-rhamnosidase